VLERGILSGGTERTREGNFDWRNRADCRVECLLEEQSELDRVMLTGVTERTGEWDVDWRIRAEWKV